MLNVGIAPSYIRSVQFTALVDGALNSVFLLLPGTPLIAALNPGPGAVVEPGRKLNYYFRLEELQSMNKPGKEVTPLEVVVFDEIDNEYRVPLSQAEQKAIMKKT
jgi:hypothetical protein